MKRNCYLDLRLHPSSPSMNDTLTIRNKLVAIIHDGRPCIFDITEFQAREIIWLASGEMEERIGGLKPPNQSPAAVAASMYMSRGLSVKRSLQNFLRNRKKRSQIKATTSSSL